MVAWYVSRLQERPKVCTAFGSLKANNTATTKLKNKKFVIQRIKRLYEMSSQTLKIF